MNEIIQFGDSRKIKEDVSGDRIVQLPENGALLHVSDRVEDLYKDAGINQIFLDMRKGKRMVNTYIIKDKSCGLYKIGKAIDIETRKKALDVANANLEIVFTISANVETELHKKFASKCVKSEWYSLTDNDIEYIMSKYKDMKDEIKDNTPCTIVYNENSNALTNSVLVARKFEKKHKHVLEAIRNIIAMAENSAVKNMFVKSSYLNEKNQSQPMYVMNRDGFSLLAMGFTGKQSLKFKTDFIAAFNKMEQIIKQRPTTVMAPKTSAEMLLMYAEQMVEQERKLQAMEAKQQKIEEKISEMEVRTKTDAQYSTIVGFANRFGLRLPLEKAATLGRVAVNLCASFGLETGRVADPRFGSVRTYPDSILFDVFEKYYPNIRFR